MIRILIGLLALIGAVSLATVVWFISQGVSARATPPRLEVEAARTARHWLIPRAARNRTNPVERTPDALTRARRHFADHCASCHGNDGRGDTVMGRGLYPLAPDMTLAATQDLSDGELFWIIENGVKLTGMPAWGDSGHEDDAEAWELVHFIRHLPELTAEEIEDMERYNPVSRAELEEESAIQDYLREGEPSASSSQEKNTEHRHEH